MHPFSPEDHLKRLLANLPHGRHRIQKMPVDTLCYKVLRLKIAKTKEAYLLEAPAAAH
jgi:hypothetical protein